MASLKNAKHEKFCQVWHETGNKTQAYRDSHPSCANWKDETINNKGYALSKRGEILARYEELQSLALKSHGITIESLLKDLERVMKLAESAETPQCSASISAIMNKAKLVGLDVHKSEQTIKVEAVDDFNDV